MFRPVRVRLPRALGQYVRARSTICRLPMMLLPLSSALTSYATKASTIIVPCGNSIAACRKTARLILNLPAYRWMLSRSRYGGEQHSALYRDGSSPLAEGCRISSGIHLLLERGVASADGHHP